VILARMSKLVFVPLLATSLLSCSSADDDDSSMAGGGKGGMAGSAAASAGKSTAGSAGGNAVPIKENHCVIEVTGGDVAAAKHEGRGPINAAATEGADASYVGPIDQSGFYCTAAAPFGYSLNLEVSTMGRLDEMIPYEADESSGNYRFVNISYSVVVPFASTDPTKRRWWSCHAGMESPSGSVAKGDVGELAIALDSAEPQTYVGENPNKYWLGGTVHADCPAFASDAALGTPGEGSVSIDISFE
jgi:hypothetical protein